MRAKAVLAACGRCGAECEDPACRFKKIKPAQHTEGQMAIPLPPKSAGRLALPGSHDGRRPFACCFELKFADLAGDPQARSRTGERREGGISRSRYYAQKHRIVRERTRVKVSRLGLWMLCLVPQNIVR